MMTMVAVVMMMMMMMPGLLCSEVADRSSPFGWRRGGRGRAVTEGGGPRNTHTKRAPAGSSEDRDRPELNSTLQIGAAVFQVEQSGGAPHRW